MLSIKNINVKFGENLVLDNCCIEVKSSCLTIISGESGSGKSTLIDAIMGEYDCKYKFKNKELDTSDVNAFYNYLYNHVSVVYQIPEFNQHLTVREHIDFILKLYNLDNDYNVLINELNIGELLNKYPGQLSGGEKTRVAIYLSLLKEPDILVLDEPTAALDKDNKFRIISLLKEYASSGHIVIASSHDRYLIEKADVLYKIANKKVIKIKENVGNEKEKKHYDKRTSTNHFLSYIIKEKKHYKLYEKIMPVMISATIAMIVSFSFLNNSLLSYMQDQLTHLMTDELIVYKNPYIDNSYNYNGTNYPMKKIDYDIISNINGVEGVYWRYDLPIDSDHDIYSMNEDKYSNEDVITFTSYVDDEIVKSYQVNLSNTVNVYTYIDERNYSNRLIQEFSKDKEGVYLTEKLYTQLFAMKEGKEDNKKEIEFYLAVPIYNSSGITTLYNEYDESMSSPGNCIICEFTKVRLPVIGVVKGTALGGESQYNEGIYLSQSQLLKYTDKFGEYYEDERTLYWIREYRKTFINELPEGYTLKNHDQIVYFNRWTPDSTNAYTVILEDITDLEKVATQLREEGYNVSNEYLNMQMYMKLENNSLSIVRTTSMVIFIFLLIFYIYMKYVIHLNELKNDLFLQSLGLNDKVRKYYFYMKWLLNLFIGSILSILIFYLIRFYLESTNIAIIQPQSEIFIIIAALVFVVEIIIPLFLKKVIKYD